MKVCSVCQEIVSSNQRCDRSKCPVQSGIEASPNLKIETGLTGGADKVVQTGLDRAGEVTRGATRQTAFVLTAVFSLVVLFAVVFKFSSWTGFGSAETVMVTAVQEANVRNAASTEGSMVLETVGTGTQFEGHWVNGSTVPSERWFELKSGGKFVWGGNLQYIAGSSDDVNPAAQEATAVAPNAMAFAGKYPSEKIGRYEILDAPDLQSTIKNMPNGSKIWSQIVSEYAALQIQSSIEIIKPGRHQGIAIKLCEMHNCGGLGSRQLLIEYFPNQIPEERMVFVCFLREYNLQSFDSWGNHSMNGEDCTEGGFDYGD